MARICIVTSGHFCMNPRVWREADALSDAAHEVTVVGVDFDPVQTDLDRQMMKTRSWRHRVGVDIRGGSIAGKVWRNWYRLRSRLGKLSVRHGGRDPHALGYAVNCLLDAARDEKADLTIVHLEPALWVGTQLQDEGYCVGVDFEDWHSENELTGDPGGKAHAFLASLERRMMRTAVHKTTTSNAMAGALSNAYGSVEPEVIYNSVRTLPCPARAAEVGPVRMIWFSQTLGGGRGLEDLFRALPLLEGNWNLELRANASPAAKAWLEEIVPASLRERVQLRPTVAPDQLSAVVAGNDIGLALEVPACRNKDLTASNKIFEYLQSGLFVVASDTAGQREVLARVPGAGELYRSGQPGELAVRLNHWIAMRAALSALRVRVHGDANACFAYEHQIPRLLASVERALCDRGRH